MKIKILFFVLAIISIFGCGAEDDLKDIADVALDPPSREEIDRSKVGVTNFFTDTRTFGSVDSQFADIRQTLGIRFVRVLIPWIETLQGSANGPYNFSQADSILNSIPAGVDVLVVLAHTPSWFINPNNRSSENPREAWVNQFVAPVVARYKDTPGIIGWEIFNEPDVVSVASDQVLNLTNPDSYVDLLKFSYNAIRQIDPERLVVMAASRSIQQNWPLNFNYNKAVRDAGALDYTDIWNIHYYGKQYEKVVINNGVAEFLNDIAKPVWVTESGEQGPNRQQAYAEEVWPFLTSKIPSIDRIYYYQYSSTAPLAQNFGLRTNDPGAPVSDLYVELRDGGN